MLLINLVMLLITTVQSLPNGHHNTWSASTSLTEADATASSEFTTANVKEAVGMQTLGSSGARAGDTGAASSFGLGPGGGGSSNAAAGPDASSVVSMGNAGYSEVSSTVGHAGRDKRTPEEDNDDEDDTVLLSIGQSRVDGSVLNAGSTGIKVGPVSTAVSLASTSSLLSSDRADTAQSVNAGSTAAHAGSSDSTASFSNSNMASNADRKKRQST
ncbi:uncharacterized protein isoform X2 [Rhodnius prolixus]|uniref:Uncharacterized protein n=2 Tax=Rhodnius prolixus TaxID=13249 RepID=T1HDY8_RHOPR